MRKLAYPMLLIATGLVFTAGAIFANSSNIQRNALSGAYRVDSSLMGKVFFAVAALACFWLAANEVRGNRSRMK